MPARRRATQADVAREAGVSRSLVSRAMRGLDKVSDDKRERILAAAAKLGYMDNGLATALAGNRPRRVIGFLPQDLTNGVFTDVYSGLKSMLDPEHYEIVVVEGAMDPDLEDSHLRQLVSYAPDCVILAGYAGSTGALAAAVHAIPVISVTRKIDMEGIVSVYGDDLLGAQHATEYLIEGGHERIVHVQLPPSIPYEDRAHGYEAAMLSAGLTPRYVTPLEPTRESAADAVSRMLATGDRPSALLCGNDVMAFGAMEALERFGLPVPQAVSVIGYDNQRVASLFGLTTVDQGAMDQGAYAGQIVQSLLAQAELPTPELASARPLPSSRVIQPRLVVRGTALVHR